MTWCPDVQQWIHAAGPGKAVVTIPPTYALYRHAEKESQLPVPVCQLCSSLRHHSWLLISFTGKMGRLCNCGQVVLLPRLAPHSLQDGASVFGTIKKTLGEACPPSSLCCWLSPLCFAKVSHHLEFPSTLQLLFLSLQACNCGLTSSALTAQEASLVIGAALGLTKALPTQT